MKFTLLTNFKQLTAAMLMMVCCLAPTMLAAQVDCDVVTVTCNDMVQVSLNTMCEQALEFDMIVENPDEDGTYTVTLADINGDPIYDVDGDEITDNVITAAQIGDTIQVTATLDDCDISCWGYAIIRDKLAPVITCEDITVDCGADFTTVPVMPAVATDNCGDPVLTFEDLDDGIMCDVVDNGDGTFTQYSSILERVWTATDASGNSSSCTQNIFVSSVDVNDVVFPDDYIVEYDLDDDCSVLDLVDVDPSISGTPSNFTCPSLKFTYSDLEFEMCGASTKILRTWFAIDWCTGEFVEEGQNIEAFDDEGPVVQCGETCYEIFATDGCTVDFNIPAPVNGAVSGVDPLAPSYFDCSDVTFRVFIGFVDQALITIDVDDDPCGEEFNDLPITYEEVLPNASGEYIYEDADIGLWWFRYDFVDACGNPLVGNDGMPTFCTADVVVRDGSAPNAICEGNTKVSLNATQEVEVFATTIDDNSFDLCGEIVSYQIKRIDNNLCVSSDSQYGDSVTFCCTDAHGMDIPVMLQVTDDSGNIDECVAQVCVSDFVAPTILCPADDTDTIDCSDSFDDAVFGDVTLSTNCPGTFTPVTTYDESGLSDCGVGTVIKTITYTDAAGNSVGSCDLTIFVQGDGGLNASDITCPSDLNNLSCTGGFSPLDLNSEPTINSNSACVDVVVSHVDSEPFVDPNISACYSITRKWTIIDWCTFSVDDPSAGQFTCTQQLNFNSTSGPVFTNDCDITLEFADDDLDCEHPVVLTAVATDPDGCTPNASITYSYEIDAFSNGIVDFTGDTNDASDTYPVGCHIVTYYATDNCGNTSSCEQEFCITSDKEPTPICRAELIWAMGADGTTEVWASDFNIKSESACGSDETLSFSFTADGLTPAMTYTCDDIPNGIGVEIVLNMYVIDSAGNSEFCEVTLFLQDNVDACVDSGANNARVAGRVYDENFTGVQQFEVELEDLSDDEMLMDLTDDEGDYEFNGVEFYDEYLVAPVRNDLHKEGVSTLDIVMIQRHILNIEPLTSPYKIIAADADKNNSVTAADLVEIRKLILDITEEYSSNTSWQFIDANQTFIDPANPWAYETSVAIPQLFVNYANVEFVAVKTGDVNNSVSFYLHGNESEVRGGDVLNISTMDQTFKAGEQVSVSLKANDSYDLLGAQFTVDFDADVLTYLDFTEGQLALDNNKVNASAGAIAVSADFAYGRTFTPGNELTTFFFTAKQDGQLSDVLAITSDVIDAEAYNNDLSILSIDLDFSGDTAEEATGFTVYQNEPNPFNTNTVVPFYIGKASTVEIEIFNAAGTVLYQSEMSADKGNNSFTISADNIDAAGVLFYRVQTGGQSVINKMISIKN